MSNSLSEGLARPSVRPADPRFSSGPCKKHPGWRADQFTTENLGFSHRAPAQKAHIEDVVRRSGELLGLPKDWRLALVPASDTGALEMALWSLLGPRGVDALVWDSFSADWAQDIQTQLKLDDVSVLEADYGSLPELSAVDGDRDVVFVYNGTTSGVRVPDLSWVDPNRAGLTICDATSAVYAMPIDYDKLDVVTWSWQKALGGEAGFGMLALGPRAVDRLNTHTPAWPMPKIFRLTKNGKINESIFRGSTINTPSLLAIDDLQSALDWADSLGGLQALHDRSQRNQQVLASWVDQSDWVDWLADRKEWRSSTSMCFKITHPQFQSLTESGQRKAVSSLCQSLAAEGVAFDVAGYRAAPPGLRIWGGATVEASDLESLTHWLDWAFLNWLNTTAKDESDGTT
ncbi:MAG: phosphoserine aminotransferase [Candidatus Krumholzibacteriia bacterium]